MPNSPISSLHSPHVERVKALLNSRGKKARRDSGEFVIDSLQALASALRSKESKFPTLKTLYFTESGLEKLSINSADFPVGLEQVLVTTEVMAEMSDVEASQGVLGVASQSTFELEEITASAKKIAYFWQMQDPGNAGTVIRSADACGFDAVVFSDESVDIYSPKVVRSTVGSLWNIPVVSGVTLDSLLEFAKGAGFECVALDAKSNTDIANIDKSKKIILIFGNEARGIPEVPSQVLLASIPMRGKTESFNVASAATIAMYEVGLR